MATVVSIHIVSEKEGAARALDAANFIANFGLEGDWRSRPGKGRQITLIEAEALERTAELLKLPAISEGASRRQVVVRGIALNGTVGKRLRAGQLLLEVHGLCEPCRRMETSIGRGAMLAMDGRGGVCAKVIEGGVLRPGDTVRIEE